MKNMVIFLTCILPAFPGGFPKNGINLAKASQKISKTWLGVNLYCNSIVTNDVVLYKAESRIYIFPGFKNNIFSICVSQYIIANWLLFLFPYSLINILHSSPGNLQLLMEPWQFLRQDAWGHRNSTHEIVFLMPI